MRTAKNGDAVFFNVNRHLNLTNVCRASCAYCSFERKPGAKDAYTMRVEEAVALAMAMKDDGLTELHIVNGLHPTLPWKYYPRVLRELKAVLPGVALKAFTATEVHYFEEISGPVGERDPGRADRRRPGVAHRRRRRDLRLGGPQADRGPQHPLGGLVAHPPAGPPEGAQDAGHHALRPHRGAPAPGRPRAAAARAAGRVTRAARFPGVHPAAVPQRQQPALAPEDGRPGRRPQDLRGVPADAGQLSARQGVLGDARAVHLAAGPELRRRRHGRLGGRVQDHP